MKQEIQKIIDETADAVAGRLAENSPTANYFASTELLLKNYKALKALVENEEEYLKIELREHSKDIGNGMPRGGGIKDRDAVLEEIEQKKRLDYARTKARFREIERVVELFRHRRQFVVIQMYYFGETPEGKEAEQAYTWETIAQELAERDILRGEKTARRWKNEIIKDMAVCLFGTRAAVNVSKRQEYPFFGSK